MAANLDKAESSLTAVSDIAYIRGIDSSGNSVRISKADLASVLGVGVWKIVGITGNTDIDNLDSGMYDGIGWKINNEGQAGYIICMRKSDYYRFQIAFLYASNSNRILHRSYNSSSGGWSEWKLITSNQY